MSSDVTNVWQHDLVTLTLILVLKIEDRKEDQKENENRKEKEDKLSLIFSSLTIERYKKFQKNITCLPHVDLMDNTC